MGGISTKDGDDADDGDIEKLYEIAWEQESCLFPLGYPGDPNQLS